MSGQGLLPCPYCGSEPNVVSSEPCGFDDCVPRATEISCPNGCAEPVLRRRLADASDAWNEMCSAAMCRKWDYRLDFGRGIAEYGVVTAPTLSVAYARVLETRTGFARGMPVGIVMNLRDE